jgi:hypothetical protein
MFPFPPAPLPPSPSLSSFVDQFKEDAMYHKSLAMLKVHYTATALKDISSFAQRDLEILGYSRLEEGDMPNITDRYVQSLFPGMHSQKLNSSIQCSLF